MGKPSKQGGKGGGEEKGRGPAVKESNVETEELNLFTTDQEGGTIKRCKEQFVILQRITMLCKLTKEVHIFFLYFSVCRLVN